MNKKTKIIAMISLPIIIVILLIIPNSREGILNVVRLFSTADPSKIKEYI